MPNMTRGTIGAILATIFLTSLLLATTDAEADLGDRIVCSAATKAFDDHDMEAAAVIAHYIERVIREEDERRGGTLSTKFSYEDMTTIMALPIEHCRKNGDMLLRQSILEMYNGIGQLFGR